MSGIFFCFNSLTAIWRGSVSPSKSTFQEHIQKRGEVIYDINSKERNHDRGVHADLKRTGAEDTSTLVLRQVRRRDALRLLDNPDIGFIASRNNFQIVAVIFIVFL